MSAEPKRCRKLTAPERAAAGAAQQSCKRRSMLSMKIRSTRVAKTASTRCAAVATMRLVVHDGQMPRPLQENATRNSAVQSEQRARAKPCANMPHSRKLLSSRSTTAGTDPS